jgi:hypothetical protein
MTDGFVSLLDKVYRGLHLTEGYVWHGASPSVAREERPERLAISTRLMVFVVMSA